MLFSIETQQQIIKNFKDDEIMMKKLLSGDAQSIRDLVNIFKDGISPEDVVATFESNDENAKRCLYEHGKRLIELKALYRQMCLEFCERIDEDTLSQNNNHSIKK